ncbi:hypothetical protein EW146_g8344 [Bondarzewia mesenterica]|uniref:Uncharacterized protein n=1 Tax=Bondarzewia mesenterica TaxID=1095465 RepID=A0A4S4LFQ5_9AGAM|nr:hypothetical protein EW146_g8344 [Bondarzewia mesenterica]
MPFSASPPSPRSWTDHAHAPQASKGCQARTTRRHARANSVPSSSPSWVAENPEFPPTHAHQEPNCHARIGPGPDEDQGQYGIIACCTSIKFRTRPSFFGGDVCQSMRFLPESHFCCVRVAPFDLVSAFSVMDLDGVGEVKTPQH